MIDRNASRKPGPKLALVTVVLALLIGSVLYRAVASQRLEHTSLVFIGIPAILAIFVAMMPNPTSATGLIFKVMTLLLLTSGILLGEAFVCILFAAPLFFLVGVIVGALIDRRRHRRTLGIDVRAVLFLAIVLAPASLEGVLPGFEFTRDERVRVIRVVDGSSSDVAATLAGTPNFERGLPLFLRLGFPRPGATSGAGLREGDLRQVEFLHGHHPGVLTMTVVESDPGRVVFVATADDSYITHWLSWRRAEVRWREIATKRTEVSWTLTYRRRLDPAWYFKPLERYGTTLAAGYLIDTLATPRSE